MNAHQIQNGVVINTIVVDSLDVFPDLIEATHGGIGWTWDGETLTAPPAPPTPIPESVTRAQAKLALLHAGLLSSVQPAIDSIPDATARTAAQIDWDDRLTFERSNGSLVTMAAMMGMTDTQIDDLFIAAFKL